jgi:hypothetical protein
MVRPFSFYVIEPIEGIALCGIVHHHEPSMVDMAVQRMREYTRFTNFFCIELRFIEPERKSSKSDQIDSSIGD